MYGSAARSLVRRAVEGINAGEVGPALKFYAEDAALVFPGDHSWEATYEGKDEIERFVRRTIRAGIKFQIHEVVVKGPPWRLVGFVRFSVHARDSQGDVVYRNRGVLFLKGAWGKITFEEIYEDTQKVAEFDEYLGVA
jgi:ketosteroid isomerase-like protein